MKIKMLFILLLCFLTSGCWNYNELNDFAIVTGMGIDKHEDGYKISLMISNSQSTQSGSSANEAQTTVFTGVGSNFSEALVNIEMKNPRTLYLGHLAVVVIDENIAKDDISPILEALMRNPETAKKYYLILARDNKAEDIVKTLSPLEVFPSENIALNIKSASQNEGISKETTLSNLLIDLLKPGINPTLASISIQGDPNKVDNQEDLKETEPNAMLKIKTLGLFKDYKLVTWTTEKESKGINIMKNNINRMYLTNEDEDGKQVVVLLDKINCKSEISIDGDASVNLNVKATGAIVETNQKIDLEKPKTIEKINQDTEESIKKLVYSGIDISKEYKTDIIGFGNMIYKKNPKYWYDVKENWNDLHYPNLKIKVNVSVNLKTKGSLENTIKEKNNES